MSELYDPAFVETYYDALADEEWERLTKTPDAEAKLHVHSEVLAEHLTAGARVLEIGAGAGRFTKKLAELGVRITVADLSKVQVDLNRRHAVEEGFESAVESWHHLNMLDMSCFADAQFDHVVCYGGALSYCFEQVDAGLAELHRVLQPAGKLLISVMSRYGTVKHALAGVLDLPPEENWGILKHGNLHPSTHPTSKHHCHLFTTAELATALSRARLDVLELLASNALTVGLDSETLALWRADPERWAELLKLELHISRQPGSAGMGTHLIAVARKRR